MINILGLTIALCACVLLMYFVNHEKSYDNFHSKSKRIYRLRMERTDKEGGTVRFASCCPPAGLHIRNKYPEVEKVARIFRYKASVSYQESKYFEERMFFAEPEFLEMFDFKFTKGDPGRLNEPNIAYVSEKTAQKYFGLQNPVGLYLSLDKNTDFLVAGVFENIPHNSHIKFDILLSYKNLLNIYGNDVENAWGHSGWFTYILMQEGINANVLANKLPSLIESENGEVLQHYNLTMELPLQALTDIHLNSHYLQEFEANGNANTVKYLSLVAILIMVLAWVNYINLSTARALSRAREVGLRKASGAMRSQLVLQFFLETIFINAIAVFLSLAVIAILLNPFCELIGIPVDYTVFASLWFWRIMLVLFASGTLLSGIYPVLLLTSFKPAEVIKSKIGRSFKGIHSRKILVVTQYVMAIGLVAFTILIYKQLSFMRNDELGFSKEQKLVVQLPRVRPSGSESKFKAYRNTVLSNPSVSKMCVGTEVPGRQIYWDAGAIKRLGSDENKNYRILGIDYDYIDLFQLDFVVGRNFSRDFPSDSSALILNERAVEWMGFGSAQEALGKQVDYWGKVYNIIGVLKNYHQESVKQNFVPQIFRFMPHGRDVRGNFIFEISGTDHRNIISEIKKHYNDFFPNNPFDFFFLDEYYNQQYKADGLFGKVIGIFSILAIFITCMGIFGMVTFVTQYRIKEMGIRKVNGANISNILFLLNKEIIRWVFISILIASPAAWFLTRMWLRNFAAKTNLSWWIFVLSGVLVLILSLLTVSWQSWKAATRNPVEILRHE